MLAITKGTLMAELDYEDMLKCLFKKSRRNLWQKGNTLRKKQELENDRQKGTMANADNGSCKEMYRCIKKNKAQNNVQDKTMGNGQLVGAYGWELLGIVSPIFLLHSYGRRNRTDNKRNHRKLPKND